MAETLWRRLTIAWLAPRPPAESETAPASFRAFIALAANLLPEGVERVAAADALRRELLARHGAEWVSITHASAPLPQGAHWLRVLPAGHRTMPETPPWRRFRAGLEAELRALLSRLPRHAPAPQSDAPSAPAGFSETGGRREFDEAARRVSPAIDAAIAEAMSRAEPEALSDTALLETLLDLVNPRGSRDLARALAARFGSFAATLAAPVIELQSVPGMGTHSLAALKLMHGVALRLARARVMTRPVLDCWDRLMAYLTAALARERVEQFRILFLDGERRLLADEAQARGTVDHTPVYPREVARRALELEAAAIILVHNHPSGDPAPSADDLRMTRLVREALEQVSVRLEDHVIIGNGRWLGFRREGFLETPG